MTESTSYAAINLFDAKTQEDMMTVASHVEELRKKHQHLSDAVERAQKSPGTKDLDIVQMKQQKLRIKEQITRLAN